MIMYSINWKTFVAPMCLALIASVSIGLIFLNNGEADIRGRAEVAEGTGSKKRFITLVAQDADIEIAPGKTVKMWTFNGTAPAPPLRFTEGDNISVKFINKTPIPHTIHFHGNHDDLNDGVEPQVMPNQTYIYNITAAPAGLLMYHCHAYPTSLHIRMGMYGAMIVDPKDKPLQPAREFVMVMGEYDTKNIMNFEAEYYPINGYADQYVSHPIKANYDELVRLYVINIGTTIPYQFHLHSATFMAYPSGLVSNNPIHAQTFPVGPGDATIIEAKWKYPGTYLFHSHGIQEERGNMGEIILTDGREKNAVLPKVENQSISMFDWQYELQKQLQKPKITQHDDKQLNAMAEALREANPSSGHGGHGGAAEMEQNQPPVTNNPPGVPTAERSTANSTGAEITTTSKSKNGTAAIDHNNNNTISIVLGAANPSNEVYFDPSNSKVKAGKVTWVNDDSVPHTATTGTPESGPSGQFDTGIISPGSKATISVESLGHYPYYCTLHPYMTGVLEVQSPQ
nr:multicopper oxidase domain-containing protein [uncultured Nitrososphaera sp.]